MTKGTPSMGKRAQKDIHIRCRRCGKPAYHKIHKECASCGFGKSAKLRKYTWQKETKR
ncbi:50S ribosomal protein L37e [archaeon]|nr:50S ribosomal protein L37e [archaeon]|tara:strand:- start:646 stop:819 length:174 start_codon:yes stop_codon:yes gene_type:complete